MDMDSRSSVWRAINAIETNSYTEKIVLTIQKMSEVQVRVRLREAIDAYRAQTGERLTYDDLATRTGLSKSTIASLAGRPGYDTRLSTIARLCAVLNCAIEDILSLEQGA